MGGGGRGQKIYAYYSNVLCFPKPMIVVIWKHLETQVKKLFLVGIWMGCWVQRKPEEIQV